MCASKNRNKHSKYYQKKRHFYPERGWIQFLILRLIYEKPTHGYRLMENLESRSFVQPKRLESGAVYTILRRMESHGLLTSKWEKVETGSDRRIYKITVNRQALMKDLVNFYNQHFQKQEDTQE